MQKIGSLQTIARFSKEQTIKSKKVGLVVGSFDILHLGHIRLFRFAKKYVDYLIIGLDNDQTIKLVKGDNRPINSFARRSQMLSDLETVDKVFEIKTVSHHDSEAALKSYNDLIKKISPTHIFTHRDCDSHWKNKKKIAKDKGIVFMLDRSRKVTNSGTILKIISSEL